jgi:hypothetical protein
MSGTNNYRIATGHCAETQFIRNGRRLDDHDDVWIPSTPCTLTVELLKGEEYNLFDGSSVWAYVQAKNRLGHSPVSDVGNGAILPSRPEPPFAPTLVSRTIDTIQVTWELGADNGAPITQCSLWYQDTDDFSANELGPFRINIAALDNRQYTAVELINGNTYRFQVACSNIGGQSGRSDSSYFMAGIAPLPPIRLRESMKDRSA